jgi:hypothetical protein
MLVVLEGQPTFRGPFAEPRVTSEQAATEAISDGEE